MGHLFYRAFVSSSKIMKEKIIAKTLGQIHPFNRFKFLYQITCCGAGTLKCF